MRRSDRLGRKAVRSCEVTSPAPSCIGTRHKTPIGWGCAHRHGKQKNRDTTAIVISIDKALECPGSRLLNTDSAWSKGSASIETILLTRGHIDDLGSQSKSNVGVDL